MWDSCMSIYMVEELQSQSMNTYCSRHTSPPPCSNTPGTVNISVNRLESRKEASLSFKTRRYSLDCRGAWDDVQLQLVLQPLHQNWHPRLNLKPHYKRLTHHGHCSHVKVLPGQLLNPLHWEKSEEFSWLHTLENPSKPKHKLCRRHFLRFLRTY